MSVVSQAQHRYFRAHEGDQSKLGAVARDFIAASHGMKVSKLPQHVKGGKPAKKRKLPVFGSLSPTQSGHYDGDMPE